MILRAKPIATTLEEKTPLPEQKSLLPTAPYYSISLKERRRNPEFAQLTENMTRETLVRHLQRQFRSRHGYRFTGKYIESLRVPLSLQFLRFPHGNKYLEHAERIRIIKNGWTLLDYNDPEFTRNIYKALHLGKITLNEMVTALLIHDFKEAHPESFAIKQYPFGSKGPYYVEDITYISIDRLKAFKKSLKQLPLHETCYFSLRVSRLFEVSFIYDAIQKDSIRKKGLYKKFGEFLAKYLEKHGCQKSDRKRLLQQLVSSEKDIMNQAKTEFTAFIKRVEPDLVDYLEEKVQSQAAANSSSKLVRNNAHFQLMVTQLNEQLPGLALSPEYNPKDPKSPLLCQILPTMAAFTALQRAMHGDVDTTECYFSVGQSSIHLLRDLDEKPEAFHLPRQARVVELGHPDFVASPLVHDYVLDHFYNTWHDLFHVWRNGGFPFKPFMRELRQLFSTVKGYELSHAAWRVIDKDFSLGQMEKTAAVSGEDYLIDEIRNLFMNRLLDLTGDQFMEAFDKKHHNFILMIDIILHPTRWAILDEQVKAYFASDFNPLLYGYSFALNDPLVRQTTFNALKSIIADDLADNQQQPSTYEYYILRYLLRHIPGGEALCQSLRCFGLHKIIRWTRNNGFGLLKQNEALDDVPAEALYQILRDALRLAVELEDYYSRYPEARERQSHFAKALDGLLIKDRAYHDNRSAKLVYYLLRMRLDAVLNSGQLCDDLRQFGIDKVVTWSRDEGLHLVDSALSLEDLPAASLAGLLREELKAAKACGSLPVVSSLSLFRTLNHDPADRYEPRPLEAKSFTP